MVSGRPGPDLAAIVAGRRVGSTAAAGDDQLSVAELDATDGVITACAMAVAETGTLILDGSPDRAGG